MMRTRSHRSGFTLLEVAVSVALLLLVATTAIASLRSGLTTLDATEQNAIAIDAIRELAEFTYTRTALELDALDGTQMAPVLANGAAMPGAGTMMLSLDVQAVADLDPETLVDPGASSTRLVTVTATNRGQDILEVSWLAADL